MPKPNAKKIKPLSKVAKARLKEREAQRQAKTTAAKELASKIHRATVLKAHKTDEPAGLAPLLKKAVDTVKARTVEARKPDERFLSPDVLRDITRACDELRSGGITLRQISAGVDYLVRESLSRSA